jgi:hypothetical protein
MPLRTSRVSFQDSAMKLKFRPEPGTESAPRASLRDAPGQRRLGMMGSFAAPWCSEKPFSEAVCMKLVSGTHPQGKGNAGRAGKPIAPAFRRVAAPLRDQ